jgi:hypothetical protein
MNDNVTSFSELYEAATELAESFTNSGETGLRPEVFGLDPRAGWDLFVDVDYTCIGVRGDAARKALMYYGGFEYVDESAVFRIGDWTFFSDEDSRVANHIARYVQEDEGGDEEEDTTDDGE